MAGKPEQQIYMLKGKLNDASKALEDETRQRTELKTANDQLTAELRKQKEAYSKLEKHTKNAENTANKAQRDVQNAKDHADHLINSQKGQLKSAERRYEDAARALKEWRDKYGFVIEKPAAEKDALVARLSECQSKAEKARNDIALLEEQIEGTPDQIGLHQALEQWEEHQGCSEEFAQLQDKLHDGMLLKEKLESDLTASRARYQKAKSDIKALQTRVDQLEQANKALQDQDNTQYFTLHIQKLQSDLKASTEQNEKTEADMKALQDKINQLEQTNQAFRDQENTDIEMLDDDMLEKEKLESDLKAVREQHQKAEADMKTLQENVNQLEQANKAFQDRDQSHNDMLQKLESDQRASKEKFQETESNKKALQEKADQLESDLQTTKEQYQTTKSDMDAFQGKVDQLELDLNTIEEQYQTTRSDMDALQGKADQLEQANTTLQEKADQLESNLKTTKEQYQITKSNMEGLQGKADQLESDLKTTKEQYRTTKTDMEALRGKADQLEQANQKFQEKENKRLQTETFEKKEQDEEKNKEIADAVQRGIEERMSLIAQQKTLKKPEQDGETQQLRIETSKEVERSQVTPPSSPTYTTDEGSQDLENTPRPKKSLRQDLGYSSRDQSDEEQSDVSKTEQQGAMMSKQAETGEEKKAGAEAWETDDSKDAEEHNKGSMRQGMKKLFSMERQAKNLEALEIRAKERAKEQSEALETLFECTPSKANVIDRRLKALGPGCRLYEAPALVAYELSGIPEDTYKGLASGQLIATMAPNEVKDVGTDPDIFVDDMATDTTDLLAEEVASPLFFAQDMATDTTDLPVKEVTTPHARSSHRALFLYFLMSLMIIFVLVCLYMGLKFDSKPETQRGLMYKNVYSHRHTPFPNPSLCASTPITFVYPPTPAPQLGMAKMMKASSLGGVLNGREW